MSDVADSLNDITQSKTGPLRRVDIEFSMCHAINSPHKIDSIGNSKMVSKMVVLKHFVQLVIIVNLVKTA